jgi:hypothetical protein
MDMAELDQGGFEGPANEMGIGDTRPERGAGLPEIVQFRVQRFRARKLAAPDQAQPAESMVEIDVRRLLWRD